MSNADPLSCPSCLGTGYAHTQDPQSGDWTRREWACHDCRGTGLVDCSICGRPKANRHVGEAPVCRECVATADTIPAPPPPIDVTPAALDDLGAALRRPGERDTVLDDLRKLAAVGGAS